MAARLTPRERALINRANVISSWAKTRDRKARTRPMFEARVTKHADLADPNNEITDPAERYRVGREHLRADMMRLSAKASQARRAKAAAKKNGGARLDSDAAKKSGHDPDGIAA